MNEQLMDIKQTAEYLQMNKMTVYKLAREGKIPAFRVASEWRFKRDLIDQWLMSQLKGKKEFDTLKLRTEPPRKTILVVDDEERIRDFFSRMLSEYRILTAASGEEAIYAVKKEKPEMVLLDLKMPGLDGIETLKEIKKIDPGVIVIMISAHGSLQTTMEAGRLGAYDSISKPFDLEQMKSVISNALVDSGSPSRRKSKKVK